METEIVVGRRQIDKVTKKFNAAIMRVFGFYAFYAIVTLVTPKFLESNEYAGPART